MLNISPAPWVYKKQQFWHEILDAAGNPILETSIDTIPEVNTEANTKLMALAPEMLALLKFIQSAKYKKDINARVAEFFKKEGTL